MEDKDHGGKQDQLDKHSLPGTNQAGKGPGSSEENDQVHDQEHDQENVEEHSLPGTNQAGKGPDSAEENDQENGREVERVRPAHDRSAGDRNPPDTV